jgi:hypothetical protein
MLKMRKPLVVMQACYNTSKSIPKLSVLSSTSTTVHFQEQPQSPTIQKTGEGKDGCT